MYKADFPTAAVFVINSTFMDDFAAGAENDDCVINFTTTKSFYTWWTKFVYLWRNGPQILNMWRKSGGPKS
jgi:hypothetical protein